MSAPSWWLLDAALRGVLVALLAVLVVAVATTPRLGRDHRVIGLALLVGLAVQTVVNAPVFESNAPIAARAPWVGVSVGNGAVFWLFVRSLVDDDFRLRPRHVAVWVAVVLAATFDCAFVLGRGIAVSRMAGEIQRAVPLAFALLSVGAATRHWRIDLVEKRRWLRGFIVVAGIGYVVTIVALRAADADNRMSSGGAVVDVGLLLGIVGVVAARWLRIVAVDPFAEAPMTGGDAAVAPAPDGGAERNAPLDVQGAPTSSASASATPPPELPMASPTGTALPAQPVPLDPADERLAATLERAMGVDRLYRSEDLSIASLASRLGVPEYRLRRVINRQLGHRNFNAYVNGFRLADAKAALADRARRDEPILVIALDAGFQSIGPFNRAFKADTGTTPGEFRRQALSDS